MLKKWGLKDLEIMGFKPKITGLGDLIHTVARPIAVALKLPCIDAETKELKPESPCAKRRAAFNDAFPLSKS